MNLLLDTHVLLWSLENPNRLSQRVSEAVIDSDNEVWISTVSVWEIIVKAQRGKLTPPPNWVETTLAQGFRILHFEVTHALAVANLPLYHRDPFDRALLAQASVERLEIVTSDAEMKKYYREVRLFSN